MSATTLPAGPHGAQDVAAEFQSAAQLLAKLTETEGGAAENRPWTIHPTDLRSAVALLFFSWKKGGFGISGIAGHGFLVKISGASSPVFIKAAGASIGLSAGFESGQSVMLLKTEESVQAFLANQGLVDLDFGVIAGSDRHMGADQSSLVGGKGKGHVDVYNVASGAMIDLSLSGIKFSVDTKRNAEVYGSDAAPEAILSTSYPASSALTQAIGAIHQKAISWQAPS